MNGKVSRSVGFNLHQQFLYWGEELKDSPQAKNPDWKCWTHLPVAQTLRQWTLCLSHV